jgi:hypothetical protein
MVDDELRRKYHDEAARERDALDAAEAAARGVKDRARPFPVM